MGQVPRKILFIGRGRVSRHFQHYFDLLGKPYAVWHREQSIAELKRLCGEVDRVALLIRDDAIESFYQQHLDILKHKITFHCSGSLALDQLSSAHPLMAFAHRNLSLATYQTITFVTESNKKSLSELLPELSNPNFSIPSSVKPFYHALCVCAGNLPLLIQRTALKEFGLIGIPKEALSLYLKENLQNLLQDPETALTGPIVRGDQTTIERNLKALDGHSLKNIYLQFLEERP